MYNGWIVFVLQIFCSTKHVLDVWTFFERRVFLYLSRLPGDFAYCCNDVYKYKYYIQRSPLISETIGHRLKYNNNANRVRLSKWTLIFFFFTMYAGAGRSTRATMRVWHAANKTRHLLSATKMLLWPMWLPDASSPAARNTVCKPDAYIIKYYYYYYYY